MEQNILIRHLGPGEAKVDEFAIESFVELSFGREPSCHIHFDPARADMVSRRHARLTISNRDPLKLVLTDLDSRNGTFVNSQRIQGEVPLLPGDRVQLGPGGPEFQVDVYPPAETKTFDPAGAETKLIVLPPSPVVQREPAGPVQKVPPPPPRVMRPASAVFQAPAGPVQKAPAAVPAPVKPAPPVAPRSLFLWGGVALMALGLLLTGVWAIFGHSAGKLSTKVYVQKTVMTGAYKAYGNPEAASGKYWFAKVVLENTGKGSVRDVKVSYNITDYISWTTPDEAPEILPGETVVFAFYPKFPAKVTSLRTRTPSLLEIKIDSDDGAGHHTAVEKREFEFRGLNEFEYTSLPKDEIVSYYDVFDNDPLLAAYVTDEDQVVKTFYAKVSEASGGINVISSGKELMQLGRSVYDYMVSLGMTYSGAKGVPETIGDVSSLVQSIRVPRDVIYGNSGLCIELALLWCSIGQAAGAKAHLVLIPGHAFTILEANDGTLLPIETTAIGGAAGGNLGAAATFDQAVQSAQKTLQETRAAGRPLEILDIHDLQNRGIRPPELGDVDRPELVRMLDDLRARHGQSNAKVAAVGAPAAPRGGGGGTPAGVRTWQDPNRQIAVSYPADWIINTQGIVNVRQVLPGYAFAAMNPTRTAGLDVAFFSAPSVQDVFRQYSATLTRLGMTARTGQSREVQIGGRSVMMMPLTVAGRYSSSGTLYIARVRTGFVMVGTTALQPGAGQWTQVLSGIGASLRFGN